MMTFTPSLEPPVQIAASEDSCRCISSLYERVRTFTILDVNNVAADVGPPTVAAVCLIVACGFVSSSVQFIADDNDNGCDGSLLLLLLLVEFFFVVLSNDLFGWFVMDEESGGNEEGLAAVIDEPAVIDARSSEDGPVMSNMSSSFNKTPTILLFFGRFCLQGRTTIKRRGTLL